MLAVSSNFHSHALYWPLTCVLANPHNSARHQQPHFSDEGTDLSGMNSILRASSWEGGRWALSPRLCPPGSKIFLPWGLKLPGC